jgi:hypothetical protein
MVKDATLILKDALRDLGDWNFNFLTKHILDNIMN